MNHLLNNLINDLRKYVTKRNIVDRIVRLNIASESSDDLILLLFKIGKNLALGPSQNLIPPQWLDNELQKHFVDYHNNGHDLNPCNSSNCSKINISARIQEMITHTIRVCVRAGHIISNREIDKCLEDHHQDKSVQNAICYIKEQINLLRKFPITLISDVSAITYFVMQMSISLLSSDDEQFTAIRQNLLILKKS